MLDIIPPYTKKLYQIGLLLLIFFEDIVVKPIAYLPLSGSCIILIWMWTLKSSSLTLVADLDIQTLIQFKEQLPSEWGTVSVGIEFSSYLISEEVADYSRTIPKWLNDRLRDKGPDPIICIDIDILFYPTFDLDPLTLFRQISRHTQLIILWPGTYKDGVLSYAVPEHAHYRYWKNLEGVEIKGVADALQ